MPIPDAGRALVSREKVHDYLLNSDHPDGGSKAIWFRSLGYEPSLWQTLANDLLEVARLCDRFDTQRSPHGVKYNAAGFRLAMSVPKKDVIGCSRRLSVRVNLDVSSKTSARIRHPNAKVRNS